MSSAIIINQFTDKRSDQKNHKLFLLADGLVSPKTAILEIVICTLLAFLFAMQKDMILMVLCLVLFFVTGIGYSLPPFLWKDKPIAGLFINMLGGLLTFLVGWQITATLNWYTLIIALPYIFAVGAVFLLTTIPDEAGDKLTGKITFAVRYNLRTTIRVALFFEITCLITAILLRDFVILFPALATFPFFVKLLFKDNLTSIIQAARFAILFLSIAVALFFPFYAFLMIGIFLLSKWYYRNRFQLNYPSFSNISE